MFAVGAKIFRQRFFGRPVGFFSRARAGARPSRTHIYAYTRAWGIFTNWEFVHFATDVWSPSAGRCFSVKKSGQKNFLGQDCGRLAAGRSLLQGLASTPRRRGVPFTRVRRRGLRSMSGHPAYAWGNPPTLRRSSFPQRASRPAGGPIPKHAWGCAPRPPNA